MAQRKNKGSKPGPSPSPATPARQRTAPSTPPEVDLQTAPPELVEQVRTEMVAMGYMLSGPLPPPQILERYDKVIPGGAERIVGWVEKQSAHRQDMERTKLEGDLRAETRGQWFALVVTLATLAASTFLIWSGKSATGIALILTELAALAGVFVYGREAQRREREKMRKELRELERDEPSED